MKENVAGMTRKSQVSSDWFRCVFDISFDVSQVFVEAVA